MKVTFWGTRGSLASPGPDTVRYGGNTSCVSVERSRGTIIVLDAGTGIRTLGLSLAHEIRQIHILLTHLHMDHIQGLPFFAPLRRNGVEVHIWGPASNTLSLKARLQKYLSPPLFPVSLRELAAEVIFHELPGPVFEIDGFRIRSHMVVHPNPTIGYRLECAGAALTYLPDHEPALGARRYPHESEWTSGYDLAAGSDLLIHDAQFTDEEYRNRVGFGHSSIRHALQFAMLAGAKQFVPFHHDPAHSDEELDRMFEESRSELQPACVVTPSREGLTLDVDC